MPQPIVNDMYTRAPESRDVVRTFVKQAEVVEHDAEYVVLRTVAAVSNRPFGAQPMEDVLGTSPIELVEN